MKTPKPPNATRTALIAGASGLVGGFCLKELLHNPLYKEVTALVRHPLSLEHPKLKQKKVDFEALEKELKGIRAEDVYCCLGTTIRKAGSRPAFRKVDLDHVVSLGRYASQTGAKRMLVVSALGADPNSAVFYNHIKGEMESALSRLHLKSLILFRPSLLLGRRPEFRLGERIAMTVFPFFDPLLRGRLRKYRAIPAEYVARAMVRSAETALPGVHVLESDRIELLGRD